MSGASAPGGADPSMEEILASIRRILNEDEPAAPAAGKVEPAEEADVFELDPSMLVEEPAPPAFARHDELPPLHPPEPHDPMPAYVPAPVVAAPPEPPPPPLPPPLPPMPPLPELPRDTFSGLVAPEAANAAAQSVGSLRRTLEAGRASMLVRSGGPTLDEIVRAELRPILKAWLDTHLPPLVERLVQAEIERVVGRAEL